MNADSIFVAIVAVVTENFGRRWGSITAIASAFAMSYFFQDPPFKFSAPDAEVYVTWACMLFCVVLLRVHRD